MQKMVDRHGRALTAIHDPAFRRGQRPANAGQKYPAETYSADEMLRLLGACTTGLYGVRNRAAIVVMWRAGLRIAECLALEVRDLDLVNGMITVRAGKGYKRRVVGIDRRACDEIAEWLELRAGLLPRPWQGPVFITVRKGMVGCGVQQQALRESVRNLGHKARIAKRVHPHGFRHTHALDLMRAGVPVPMIQIQLGHKDLVTTAHYLNHLLPMEVVARVRALPWPSSDVEPVALAA